MKNKRALWTSLITVVLIAVIALGATLAAGWSPKLGLDLEGGLSVVYKTAKPVTADQLNTVVTILNDRVNAGHQRRDGQQPGEERGGGLHPR